MSDKPDHIIDVRVTLESPCTPAVPAVPPRPPVIADASNLTSLMWLHWYRETAVVAEAYVVAVLREYVASVGRMPATQQAMNTCTSVALGALYRMGVGQEIEAEASPVLPQVWDRDSGADLHVTIRPTAALAPVIEAARLLEDAES
jgi:hypothetical protein